MSSRNRLRVELGPDVTDVVWPLILILAPVRPRVLQVTDLFVNTKPPVDFRPVFSSANLYESVYALLIAEMLLEDASDPAIVTLRKEVPNEARQSWRLGFLANKGVDWTLTVRLET